MSDIDKELIEIVKMLSEKYTSYESTSITIDKARQLMEAAIYCINKARDFDETDNIDILGVYNNSKDKSLILSKENAVQLRQKYEKGYKKVIRLTNDALELYNKIIGDFEDYNNMCYRDTFVKGMPEFFKWYDAKFAPQEHLLMLDYPVLLNLDEYCGIDRISRYIMCIGIEQRFLRYFKKNHVISVLEQYHSNYEELIINIPRIVWNEIIITGLDKCTYGKDKQEFKKDIKKYMESIIRTRFDNDNFMMEYFLSVSDDIAVEILLKQTY